MSRVFWDTNLFIYLFEDRGIFYEQVTRLRKAMLARGDHLLTSTFTVGEILVKPILQKNEELVRKYVDAILSTAVTVNFDLKAAKIYAKLRCDRSIHPPDAIQLACAAASGTDLFITNDERLHSKHIEGIQFIVPLARAPF